MRIPLLLLLIKKRIIRLHSLEQSSHVNKRKEIDAHPSKRLPINIELPLRRVEIKNRRAGLRHERSVDFRDGVRAERREHAHELFERQGRSALGELHLHTMQVF